VSVRIIPRLDIKGPNLVKGINFEGLRVLGKPEYFAKHYYENGADELIYVDAVASLYGRNSLNHIIERTAREIFVPMVAGGGLRTLDDIREILRAGADKVAINTAAVRRPELISEAARTFGSSTIVVSIEAIRKRDGTYEQYTDYGRERTGLDAFEWAIRSVELGAGELLVTSINREGTGKGFDLELTRRIAESVSVPVIASGGAGALNHVSDVVIQGKADGVSIASMFHYNCARYCQLNCEDFHEEGNIEFLRKGAQGPKIQDASIPQIKEHLRNSGLDCRLQ